MTELELIIKGSKDNDRISQKKLYLHCFSVLSVLCRRFFDDEHEVLTAINNGMLRVFKNISQYDPKISELNTWIYAIVRNEALTIIRNNKRIRLTDELTTEMAAVVPANLFENKEEEDLLLILKKLPETTRIVCSLFYLEGYSIKETSIALEMKEGTVKWHLSEARKRLYTLFNSNKKKIANVAEG